MVKLDVDVAIIGSGFGGSIMALLCQRIGLSVALLERDAHPRFAIGESSTPLADLILAELCEQYDLPRLLPLCRYGSWCEVYPDLPRGLKRGFSYFKHQRDQPFHPRADRANELLVAASPNNPVSDCHWYRSALDAFLVEEVRRASIPFFDRTDLEKITPGSVWQLEGRRNDELIDCRAGFVIDASGPAGVLGHVLKIGSALDQVRTQSRSVYGHFRNVKSWHDVYVSLGGQAEPHPFPCDRAALHHVFDDGWMYVLPFDNGITSAGFVMRGEGPVIGNPELVWSQWMARYPSVALQFADASPVFPLIGTGRLQRRWSRLVGENWAMLPHCAGFLDPLHSFGIAHNLAGMARMIHALSKTGEPRRRCLALYEQRIVEEATLLDQVIAGCYACFPQFEVFTRFSMLYFVAAIYGEHQRRASKQDPMDGLLLSGDAAFGRAAADMLAQVSSPEPIADLPAFERDLRDKIGPWNIEGLCDPDRHNLYPYL